MAQIQKMSTEMLLLALMKKQQGTIHEDYLTELLTVRDGFTDKEVHELYRDY